VRLRRQTKHTHQAVVADPRVSICGDGIGEDAAEVGSVVGKVRVDDVHVHVLGVAPSVVLGIPACQRAARQGDAHLVRRERERKDR
jgi:hypothetical protein